jgi:hypothetical protein
MAIEPHLKDHERTDANSKWIFVVVAGLAICVLSFHGILASFLGALKAQPATTDRWEPVQQPKRPTTNATSFPRLQVSPPVDLQEFRDHEEAELHSYGWINRTAGVVRVPIERAMDLVLKEGLKARVPGETNVGPSAYQLIEQRPQHREPEIKGEK